ncbi:peptidoglycan-binding domain-containing protein [Halanaerobacter jeridensis]|uniref:peptidoglycan-binding domain-containing protein n=1 Tax=Halanaerobacter jeridensis TaxID=706427 RepID=UPI0019581D73|nr:peptidoglycan-binding domain-containing protein [Halanaerobacter jeridensis]
MIGNLSEVPQTQQVNKQKSEKKSSVKIIKNKAKVKKVQKGLSKLGYELSIDGLYGEETEKTIRKFLEDNNLNITPSDKGIKKEVYQKIVNKSKDKEKPIITEVQIGHQSEDNKFKPKNESDIVAPGDKGLSIMFIVKNIIPGKYEFAIEDIKPNGKREKTNTTERISSEDISWGGGGYGYGWNYSYEEDLRGLIGEWKVNLYINGEKQKQELFLVLPKYTVSSRNSDQFSRVLISKIFEDTSKEVLETIFKEIKERENLNKISFYQNKVNGKFLGKIYKDNTVYWEKDKYKTPDKSEAWARALIFMKRRLKAPSTAEFPWDYDRYVTYLGSNKFSINSYVDAENSFGAKIRTHFTMELKYLGNGKWSIISLETSE